MPQVVLFGLGRYGSGITRTLRDRGWRVLTVDLNPDLVRAGDAMGHPVMYGDAEDPEFVATLPLGRVLWVISTARERHVNLSLLHTLQSSRIRRPNRDCRTITRRHRQTPAGGRRSDSGAFRRCRARGGRPHYGTSRNSRNKRADETSESCMMLKYQEAARAFLFVWHVLEGGVDMAWPALRSGLPIARQSNPASTASGTTAVILANIVSPLPGILSAL